MLKVIRPQEKLALFKEHWTPRLVGQVNDTAVKLVKFQGEFHWHYHAHEDEMFYVIQGSFMMRLRDGDVTVREGEFIIIPKGVEHMPYAPDEVHVMLIEPASTLNTGNIVNDRTVDVLERLD